MGAGGRGPQPHRPVLSTRCFSVSRPRTTADRAGGVRPSLPQGAVTRGVCALTRLSLCCPWPFARAGRRSGQAPRPWDAGVSEETGTLLCSFHHASWAARRRLSQSATLSVPRSWRLRWDALLQGIWGAVSVPPSSLRPRRWTLAGLRAAALWGVLSNRLRQHCQAS